jgi:hypothetical protein
MLIVLRFTWITLGLTWLIRAVCMHRGALDRLLRAWRWLLIMNAVIAVLGQLGIANWGVPNSENRQSGFFAHPNELAGLVAIGLPLLLLGVPDGRRHRGEVRQLLARAWPAALVFYAIATTGSMSGLIAGLAGGLTILLVGGARHVLRPGRRHTNPLVPTIGVAVAAVGFVLLATSDLPVVERFTRYSSGDAGVTTSVDSRGRSNEQVVARFDESLVVGVGFADFGNDGFGYDRSDTGIRDAAGAHNMFARFVFFAGLPGLVGMLVILGFTFKQGLGLVQDARGTDRHPTAVALLAAFVAANTFAMFQPTEYQRYYWLTVAMLGALWSLRREELRQQIEARIAEARAVDAGTPGISRGRPSPRAPG